MGQAVLNMKEGEIYLLIYDDGFIEKTMK